MNKKIIYVIIVVLVITVIAVGVYFAISGTNKSGDVSLDTNKEEVFKFRYNGKDIALGEQFSSEKCGKEVSYFEAPSCAFEGLDKTYTYEHHEITTCENENKDIIYTISLLDEQVSTSEGVKIADSYEDMVQAYGTNFENEGNLYTYTKGKTKLKFIVQNDVITDIEYSYDA